MNPFAMIERALIAAHVLDTSEIYICIKGSFHPELSRVHKAISEFRDQGLMAGKNIYIVAGPEDYLYGEEKAMLNVIEGIGPLPREAHYPPYIVGLFSTPQSPNLALVNNVETYARVPQILLQGAESFQSIGTESTKGHFICTVSGDVQNEGVFEVEAGITLRDLLYNYANGPRKGHEFKVVLNGVSSKVLAADQLDTPLDYDEMARIGSWLGSCSFIVYDDERSAVRITQKVARFLYDESCNQCPSCKGGLRIASNQIDSLYRSEQDSSVIRRIIDGAKSAPRENRCYLSVQGSIIIPSLVETFRDEFEDLQNNKVDDLEKVVLPKIADFNEQDSRFILKGQIAHEEEIDPRWSKDKFFINEQNYSR